MRTLCFGVSVLPSHLRFVLRLTDDCSFLRFQVYRAVKRKDTRYYTKKKGQSDLLDVPRSSLLGVAAIAQRRARYWQGDVDHEHESTLCVSRDRLLVDQGNESDLTELDKSEEGEETDEEGRQEESDGEGRGRGSQERNDEEEEKRPEVEGQVGNRMLEEEDEASRREEEDEDRCEGPSR